MLIRYNWPLTNERPNVPRNVPQSSPRPRVTYTRNRNYSPVRFVFQEVSSLDIVARINATPRFDLWCIYNTTYNVKFEAFLWHPWTLLLVFCQRGYKVKMGTTFRWRFSSPISPRIKNDETLLFGVPVVMGSGFFVDFSSWSVAFQNLDLSSHLLIDHSCCY